MLVSAKDSQQTLALGGIDGKKSHRDSGPFETAQVFDS